MGVRAYDDVVVASPVTVPYMRYSEHGVAWWFAAGLRELARISGLRIDAIDGVALSSFSLGVDTSAGIVNHLGLTLNWLEQLTVGGSSGVVALHRAAAAVASGQAEIVACVAGDTNSPGGFTENIEHFSQFSQDDVYPYGAGGPNGSFALLTQAFMAQTGVTAADFGAISVSQRTNAIANPIALLRKPITLDDYLNARPIADPLRMLDCVMPCAGAEAFLVTTRERARALGLQTVSLLAGGEAYNAFPDDPIALRGGWARFASTLWAQAGLGPEEVDVVHTYDDYPVIVAMQLRDLGFAPGGDIAGFLRENDLTVGGSFPHNTSGGQLSSGQAGFAGGFLGVTETIRQLTGRPLGEQVPDARVGLVSGFGMIDYDRGISASAAVLTRGERP